MKFLQKVTILDGFYEGQIGELLEYDIETREYQVLILVPNTDLVVTCWISYLYIN